MKTSKTRFISLLAVATLLVTCFCSVLPVSAERYAKTENSAMVNATIKFVGINSAGEVAEGNEVLQTLSNYNDYNSDSNGKGLQTSGYWCLIDRYMALSTDILMDTAIGGGYALNNPNTAQNFVVVEWNESNARFEVTAVYPAGTRRVVSVPRYGFVLVQYNTFLNSSSMNADARFFTSLPVGTEVQVNLDDLMALINTRQTQFKYTTYEQMILRGKTAISGYSEITISSVDSYVSTGENTTDITGSAISFNPEAYNVNMYNDLIGLYDSSVPDDVTFPTSTSGFYIPLAPVAGKNDVYEIQDYVIPAYNGSNAVAPSKATIPEGGYLLCMTHYMPSYIKYGAYGTNNTARRCLYSNLAKYFAVGKQFEIKITPEVITSQQGQVRFSEPTGLRFKTQVVGWQKKVNAGYELEAGTLIMPKDLLDASGKDFTIDALGAENAGTTYLDVKQTKWALDPTQSANALGEMQAAIVNIKEGNYGRQFAARGYVKATKNGVTEYYYSDTIANRSVREIADAALADEACDEKYSEDLQKILRGFATPAE